jgi:hypothetical protein
MNAETRSCDPTVPVIVAGDEGQLEVPPGIIQTTPVEAAWAGTERDAAANTVPTRSRIDVKTIANLFKNIPVECSTFAKTVCLSFAEIGSNNTAVG